MTEFDKLHYLTEQLGAEVVLDEVARALNTDKLNEVLDFIAKNWDVDLDGWIEDVEAMSSLGFVHPSIRKL